MRTIESPSETVRLRESTPRGPVPHARWVVPAVSVITAAWVLAQLFTGLTMRTTTWPIAGFPMFRNTPAHVVDYDLVATTASGREVPMKASDFGLQRLQLNRYIGDRIVRRGELRPMVEPALERVTRLWNAAHPADPGVTVRLIERITLFPVGSGTTSETLLTWSAT